METIRKLHNRKAFTIVELVIVIAVIAILATVLVPTFGNVINNAKDSAAKQEAKNAYTNYLIENNDATSEYMIYDADGRFVALHNGAAVGVYESKEEALIDLIGEGYDANKLVATNNSKLFVYSGDAYLPENPMDKELLTGKTISFMGDSISTFEGWSNNAAYNSTLADNRVMYNKSGSPEYQNLVSVDETWWKKTVDKLGLELCVNNSYSGSRVTSGGNFPSETGCGDRAINLHNDNTGVNPDIIVIYMGTNDYQQIGGTMTVDKFAEDYTLMVQKIKDKYPNADVYLCTLHHYDNVKAGKAIAPSAYNAKIESIAADYDCNVVDFYNGTSVTPDNLEYYTVDLMIDSADISLVHPNASGMAKMYECVKDALAKNYKIEEAEKKSYTVTVDTNQSITVGEHPSMVTEGDAFEVTLVSNAVTFTVTMGGNIIDCYDRENGKIIVPYVTGDIVITAKPYEWVQYLNELPTKFDSTTNLYSNDYITRQGYYDLSNKWIERTDLIAAILPVSGGMKLQSSSFVHVSGENKGTVISWFMEDGTQCGVSAAYVYEQQTNNGYVTVPEGVIAVCMVWRSTCTEEVCQNNYMYIIIPNQN